MDSNFKSFVSTMISTLDEKNRRIFLGGFANCLGRGGITELSQHTGISRTTITQGCKDYKELSENPQTGKDNTKKGNIRAQGGGRKSVLEIYPNIEEELLKLLDGNIIGNPENPLCWTTKSLRNLQEALEKIGIKVSYPTIGVILEQMGFSLQQNRKYVEAGDAGPDRDAQFEFINSEARKYLAANVPVISIDTKKKELVGNYKNNGAEYRPEKDPLKVNDHDFPDPEKGKVSPYGIYDIGRNEGFVNIGISADTGAFAVNSIRTWWQEMGKERYPEAKQLMITADGGGSNGRRNKQWKTNLQQFSDESGLEIHVCHFPPGTSKWNKIEHRLFSQISKNWRGRPLETIEIIVNLIATTTTKEGLTVQCVVDKNIYEKGIKTAEEELKALNMEKNDWHGEWNYVISPRPQAAYNVHLII